MGKVICVRANAALGFVLIVVLLTGRVDCDEEQKQSFSSILKSIAPQLQIVSPETTPKEHDSSLPSGGKSLWAIMKQNFYEGYAPSERENSIFPAVSPLTSALVSRNARASPWGTSQTPFMWDAAKLLGKSLLSSAQVQQQHHVSQSKPILPIIQYGLGLFDAGKQKLRDMAYVSYRLKDNKLASFQNSFFTPPQTQTQTQTHSYEDLSGAGSGWGSSSLELSQTPKVVFVHAPSKNHLLERFITAKVSILKNLILLKLRLQAELLTSTLPAVIELQLKLVNQLLTAVSQRDLSSSLFKTVGSITRALWRAKLGFLKSFSGLLPQAKTTMTTPTQVQYGVPSLSYGSSLKSAEQNAAQFKVSLRNPLEAYPMTMTPAPQNDYSLPQYSSQSYPTLPPVHYAASAPTQDAVLVPKDFLRELMARSVGGTGSNVNAQSPKTTNSINHAEYKNSFSSQLLNSGFGRN